ncbi:MAG TPA: FAD-dependent oxidoreductase [Candidatus Sulfotelmatobacter sp.]|jgi:sarcosine oxidase subunit alpha|nr:FAD-dependent oxidoreductase [Candidatus Sulfotelmatobacter sp.]
MSANRLPAPWGRRIDRSKVVRFTFDGQEVSGYEGDTIASALAANDRWVLSRSFKYHRPRGMISAAGLEANSLVQVGDQPNVPSDMRPIADGLAVSAVNTFGTADKDWGRVLEKLSRFMPVGFYYKTFFNPRIAWRFWEPVIRHLAGLGKVNLNAHHGYYDKAYLFADVAVVGGGPAGMAAALEAAKAGAEVILIDEHPDLGGALGFTRFDPEGKRAEEEMTVLLSSVAAENRITVMTSATVQGWFSDNWLPVVKGNRFYKLRAKSVVIATGASEQPMVFRNNDLPGIMLGTAAQRLMKQFGVRPGKKAVVAAANEDAYGVVLDLLSAGVDIAAVVDLRSAPAIHPLAEAVKAKGVTVHAGCAIAEAYEGRNHIRGVRIARIAGEGKLGATVAALDCDLLCLSVGYVPMAALLSHANAVLVPDPETAMPRIESLPPHLFAAGSLAGRWALDATIADGRRNGALAAVDAGFAAEAGGEIAEDGAGRTFAWPIFPLGKGKDFIDFDEDLQYRDVPDAAAQGYDHIQLLKRFSTAGMGPTQGKLTNTLVQRVLARCNGQSPVTVGTTTVRPPIGGETLGHLAGRSFDPVRLTAMHHRHLEVGARMMTAGAWMRPAYYGPDAAKAVVAEVEAARTGVGMIDVSTLGGLDIRGPEAGEFLERIYTWTYAKLPVGKVRYALMLDQGGYIIDDGVAGRLHERHYYVTATTSGVDRVYRLMQWFNAQWRMKVDIANVTAAFCGLNLIGPNSRKVLAKLCRDVDLSPEGFPYLGIRTGTVAGIPARLMRVGFGGELGYEIHVPASQGEALWDAVAEAGQEFAIRPIGIEAQRVLRLEKGHIIVSQDTDSLSHPMEAAMGWAVGRKKAFFVGKPAMEALEAKEQTRRLVGFQLKHPSDPTPLENHLVIEKGDIAGRVTSVVDSPTLGKVIGLAIVPPKLSSAGSVFSIRVQGGQMIEAVVVPLPFYDPENKRQEI